MRGTWQGSGTWQASGGGRGGGLVLVLVAVAVLVGSGAASAAVSALVTILIITGAVTGLAVLGGSGWLIYRHRARSARYRPVQGPAAWQVSPGAQQRLGAPQRPDLGTSQPLAIEPPREIHLHFHVADPAEAAAIIRTALPGQAGDITEGN